MLPPFDPVLPAVWRSRLTDVINMKIWISSVDTKFSVVFFHLIFASILRLPAVVFDAGGGFGCSRGWW